jgi:FlaA1/EpsC-like NDP-sugar epimerase
MVFASFAAAWVRYDLDLTRVVVGATGYFAILAAMLYLAMGFAIGPYRVGHLRGSFEETADLGRAVVATAVPLTAIVLLTNWLQGAPRSLAVLGPVLALGGMFTMRFVVRSYRWGRGPLGSGQQKVIIFGAGLSGRQLVRALQNDARTKYTPVAILDDEPHKRHLRVDGVRVRGNRSAIPQVALQTGATALVIAVPSADSRLIGDLRRSAQTAGLEVLILPPTDQRIGGAKGRDLRNLDLEDLLGRRRVELDNTTISAAIADKVVLVTGAGGSIGSELARQIHRYGPRKLILLDRDESALHSVQMSLTGRALLDDGTLALVSIRDSEALWEVFKQEKPQLVFHAAALKHLTLLEQFPLEAWKTNVLGTLNVLRAAEAADVEAFVNISTDKAANPRCVLGYSKRIAERLTAHFAAKPNTGRYVSVRFGNVLGSRGSVIEAFTAQIQRGGPITVTDPRVERYFMLIAEASQLVLQASVIGTGGEVMVLEMGKPVRILDVAHTLIELSGRNEIEIEFTGLRQGEKISEELFIPTEEVRATSHPLVSCVSVLPLSPAEISAVSSERPELALDFMIAEAAVAVRPPQQGLEHSGTVDTSDQVEVRKSGREPVGALKNGLQQ